MGQVSPADVIAGIFTFLSVIASGISIRVTWTMGKKTRSMTPLQQIQMLVFASLVFYHLFTFTTFAMDLAISGTPGETQFSRDNRSFWPQLGVYLTLSIIVIGSCSWLLCFWAKLSNIHFLKYITRFTDIISKSDGVWKGTVAVTLLSVAMHVCFTIIAFGDGTRIMIYYQIIQIVVIIPLLLVCLFLLVDLGGILCYEKLDGVNGSKTRFGIMKLILVCIFAITVSILALVSFIANIAGQKSRLLRNHRPEEGLNATPFIYDHADTGNVLYALMGAIISIPFIVSQKGKIVMKREDRSTQLQSAQTKDLQQK